MRRLLPLLSLCLLVAACDSTEPDPDPTAVTAVAITASETEVPAASTLGLTASVEPASAPQTVTWDTGDATVATVSSNGTVTGVTPGTVTISATSTADPTKSTTLELTVTECEVLIVDANITEPTTWDCPEVRVELSLKVGAPLTVLPGTDVVMSEGTWIHVLNDGTLTAVGTEDSTITFRGENGNMNDWGGLTIQTLSDDNILTWVEIADTGANGFQNTNQALLLPGGGTDAGRLAVTDDLLISNAGAAGLVLKSGSDISLRGRGFSGPLRFRDIDGPIIRSSFDTTHLLGQDATREVAARMPRIEVAGGTIETLVDWRPQQVGGLFGDVSIPYRIMESPRIVENGALWILGSPLADDPPLIVEFAQDVRLSSGNGQLRISGGVGVVLRGVEAVPGYWQGLQFESVSDQNVIDDVTISHAGAARLNAAVYVNSQGQGRGSVEIRDTLIRKSGDKGICVGDGGSITLENVTYEDNAGPDYLEAQGAC